MPNAPIEPFEANLAMVGATCTGTTARGFEDELDDVIDRPVVGTPLSIPDLSLASSDVSLDPTPTELFAARTGVTAGVMGIASYGSVAIESTPDGDELVSLVPPRQVAVLPASRLYPSMDAAFGWLVDVFEAGRDALVFVTGNSATADMGATVEGAHGPAEVHVIVVEDR